MSRGWLALIVLLAGAGCPSSTGPSKGLQTCRPMPALPAPTPVKLLRSPYAAPAAPQIQVAMRALRQVAHDHTRDPENPWAIAHAMLVFGPDFELTNGEPAVDWLFARYAQRFEVCGEQLLRFPSSEGSIRIEPHTDLILKALTESGVDPEREVVVQEQPARVGDLYRGSLYRAWVDASTKGQGAPIDRVPFGHGDGPGTTTEHWNDAPWSLQALASWGSKDLRWQAEGGRTMSLDRFTHAVVQRIDHESQTLQVQKSTGQRFDKGQAARAGGLVTMTCGGMHMIQGAAHALGRGFGEDGDRAVFDRQIPILFWRYHSELQTYMTMMEREPQFRALLMMQRLKFLGHFLETVHKAAALGLFKPDTSQRETMNDAVVQLVATVASLEQAGIFKILEKLTEPGMRELYPGVTTNEQLYLDYVGDAAHAYRALDLATGEGRVRR
ncbi:MAG: hypothetical protein EA397_03640 [Deltaproteobacteria bacterium]|nr:MAG: hypothetical protein EA397_03640 [Deltaproteobacteria bacterium]